MLRTRKLIEGAFRALLSERPYGEISVADIADRATINRATFYGHFEDKDHLATTMLRGDLESALLAELNSRTPLNAETLTRFATILFEFMANLYWACPKEYDAAGATLDRALQETIQDLIRMWLNFDPDAKGVFPGAEADHVATVLTWALYGSALQWSRRPHRPRAEDTARQIVALLIK